MADEEISDIDQNGIENVLALASNPSSFKVRGKLTDSGATGVFGYNQAGSGTGRGVLGRVDSPNATAAGVRGEAADGTTGAAADGVVGVTADPGDSTPQYASGVRGKATNSAGTNTAGVYGSSDDTTDGTRGVFGVAENANGGKTFGVVGSTFGGSAGAAGVLGAAVDGATKNYGVEGTTGSAATDAAGVKGSADTASGQTYGVHGTTASPGTDAAGVRGQATEGSGTTYGVYGETNSPNGFGVYSADDAFVSGALDVSGAAFANSLSTANDVSAGGNVSATNDVSAGGRLTAGTYREIGSVGATIVLENSYNPSNNSKDIVPFDAATNDDFGDFDSTIHKYVVSIPGDYHVTASIQFGAEAMTQFSDNFDLFIRLSDSETTNDVAQLLDQRGRSGQISKTVYGVREDVAISVWLKPDSTSTSSPVVESVIDGTYVTIDKIG